MMGLKLQNSCRLAIVDDEDYLRCARLKWKLAANGHVVGSFHRERITLQRFVMWYFDDDPREVRHADGDKFDCRKSNLVECEKTINFAEILDGPMIREFDPVSKYKGVSWSYAMRMWEARIIVNGRSEHISYQHSEEAAATEYDIATLQKFRLVDPATLNFDIKNYGLTKDHLR